MVMFDGLRKSSKNSRYRPTELRPERNRFQSSEALRQLNESETYYVGRRTPRDPSQLNQRSSSRPSITSLLPFADFPCV